jgi:hypothetical protein
MQSGEMTLTGISEEGGRRVMDLYLAGQLGPNVSLSVKFPSGNATPPTVAPDVAPPTSVSGSPISVGATPQSGVVEDLKIRCTRTNGAVWDLVHAIAMNCQVGVPFGLHEIANFAQMPYDDAWARFRVLGRPEKALGIKVLDKVPDSKPTQYLMSSSMQQAILAAGPR